MFVDFTTMTWGLSVLPLLRVAKMVPILTFRSPPTPGVTGPESLFLNQSLSLWSQKALTGQTCGHMSHLEQRRGPGSFCRKAGEENS